MHYTQGVQGVFLQGFVALLGCDAPLLCQNDPSCLALPSSHLPSPIPMFFFIFSLSSSSLHPEEGAARRSSACEAQLCPWHASHSVWEVNSPWHVQYVAQMFLPPPALSHAIPSVADKGYGLELWGRQSNGWEVKESYPWPSWALLALLHALLGDWRWTREVLCLEVDMLHLRGGFPWVKAVVSSQNSFPALLWALPLPGQHKEERGASQLCFIVQEYLSQHIFS